MQDLPLPIDVLASFDALNPDVDTSVNSDLGFPPSYLPDNLGFEDSSAAQQPLAPPSLISTNSMMASKVAPVRASFNPNGDLVSWRGFQISSSSEESLERLLTRFPQLLDQVHVRGASFQTLLLDRLASFVLEMHSLSLLSLRADDLARLSCEVDDLSSVGFNMSPFRVRLDLLSSNLHIVELRSEVAIRQDEDNLLSVQLSDLAEAANKLKIQLRDLESQLQNLELTVQEVKELKAANTKIRDTAITNMEALALPPLQFDTSWPLDHGLL